MQVSNEENPDRHVERPSLPTSSKFSLNAKTLDYLGISGLNFFSQIARSSIQPAGRPSVLARPSIVSIEQL